MGTEFGFEMRDNALCVKTTSTIVHTVDKCVLDIRVLKWYSKINST